MINDIQLIKESIYNKSIYDHLKILLNKYGNVNKCQSYFHKYGKYSNFSKSGHRIAWIELNDHIPRILNIEE